MDLEDTDGPMVINMKDTTNMELGRALVSFPISTENAMRETGKRESSTAEEHFDLTKEQSRGFGISESFKRSYQPDSSYSVL